MKLLWWDVRLVKDNFRQNQTAQTKAKASILPNQRHQRNQQSFSRFWVNLLFQKLQENKCCTSLSPRTKCSKFGAFTFWESNKLWKSRQNTSNRLWKSQQHTKYNILDRTWNFSKTCSHEQMNPNFEQNRKIQNHLLIQIQIYSQLLLSIADFQWIIMESRQTHFCVASFPCRYPWSRRFRGRTARYGSCGSHWNKTIDWLTSPSLVHSGQALSSIPTVLFLCFGWCLRR